MLLLRDRLRSDLLPFTQETLAEMLGVQRPTVSLVARTLQTAGLIRSRRGSVEIADGPGLEEASCECSPPSAATTGAFCRFPSAIMRSKAYRHRPAGEVCWPAEERAAPIPSPAGAAGVE